MIWLIWRQYRWAALLCCLFLAALISLFVLDAQTLNAALQQHHFTHCFDTANYIPCGIMIVPGNTAQWRTLASMVLPLFPIVMGVLLGAPLLPREYDQRTHLFAWTQSTSPTRWLSARLLVLGGATFIGFGLLAIVTTWWGLIQDNIATSPWQTFMIRGSVPVADALFGLMVGVMVGAFIRRTRSAMAVTLVLLFLLQTIVAAIFPYLLPPTRELDYYHHIQQQHLAGKFGDNPQDLFLSQQYAESNGTIIADIGAYCGLGANNGTSEYNHQINQCMRERQVTLLVTYQRFSERFWPLQLLTTALLLILAGLATALTYWQLRRLTP